ncbi:MAG: hypothetical protein PHP25_03235 [Candidatus Moranbacteria bacterium]|nr:hypothetical protein [Candidatus Moranbacteria bacterium]
MEFYSLISTDETLSELLEFLELAGCTRNMIFQNKTFHGAFAVAETKLTS